MVRFSADEFVAADVLAISFFSFFFFFFLFGQSREFLSLVFFGSPLFFFLTLAYKKNLLGLN